MEKEFKLNGGCCSHPQVSSCNSCSYAVSRRGFLSQAAAIAALAPVSGNAARGVNGSADPDRIRPIRLPLRVQPVFVYTSHERKEATSWRFTAELYDERVVADECARIGRDLDAMKAKADFPMEILPLASVKNKEQAAAVDPDKYDALIMYAAARNADVLEVVAHHGKWNLMFVRHKSGPIYYMYVGVHGHYLRKTRDPINEPALDVHDIVVDNPDDLLWRLRAISGLRNTIGKRIVTIGDAGGWGAGGAQAPGLAHERWQFDIQAVSYDDLGRRLQSARQNAALMKRCRAAADAYLSDRHVKLETSHAFVEKSFVLTEVFRDYMDEFRTDAITIRSCMNTVMQVSGTTACMPLSLLNDEGYLALCESDFVSIPAGTLLHYVSGRPVFMCNPTFPYNGEVMVSHCTAPRRMDGSSLEPTRILTHYESDFGASPKVEMRKGQRLTVLDGDFDAKRYLSFGGEIIGTPFFPMCRTQLEIGIHGDSVKLAEEVRGWHWMVCYGDYLKEVNYAARKAGFGLVAI